MTIQISRDQFDTMRREGEERFVLRAAQFLREEFPAIAGRAEPDKLAAAIRAGMARAAAYGFESERDIVQYLVAMIHLGPRFDEDASLPSAQVPLRGMPG